MQNIPFKLELAAADDKSTTVAVKSIAGDKIGRLIFAPDAEGIDIQVEEMRPDIAADKPLQRKFIFAVMSVIGNAFHEKNPASLEHLLRDHELTGEFDPAEEIDREQPETHAVAE